MKNFAQSSEKIAQYVENTFLKKDLPMDLIRENAAKGELPNIHVGAMDALHLEVIVRAIQPKKVVEIGTLAGLSGVAILRGAGPDSKLFTFEFEPKHAEVAKKSFRDNGFEKQVSVFVGPALENLGRIEAEGPFDMVFIDADKENYPNYLAWAEKNLRKGGVVIGDNTFAWGLIADTTFTEPKYEAVANAIKAFNARCADSNGPFRSTILPTGEGLVLAVKK